MVWVFEVVEFIGQLFVVFVLCIGVLWWDMVIVGLDCQIMIFDEWLVCCIDLMFDQGLVEEVCILFCNGLCEGVIVLCVLGYVQVIVVLDVGVGVDMMCVVWEQMYLGICCYV